jgi:serine/threonine protein phosphatase PrpC
VPAKVNFESGVVQVNAPNEEMCGDSWRIAERGDVCAVLIADGLGHGPLAADAAEAASKCFVDYGLESTTEFLTHCDRQLRGTRGAAVAIAQINRRSGKIAYAGVGNIAAHLRSRLATSGRGLVSHNGTVGVEVRRLQQFDYDCPEDALLVMHSDGLQSRWSLEGYPGLVHRHASLIAAVLYRDFTRTRDDVTVCVVRFSTVTAT